MTMNQMEKIYHKFSAATAYILGFVVGNNIYAITLTWEQIRQYFKLGRMSSKRGGWAKIRIMLTAEQRKILMASAEIVGTKDALEIILDGDKTANRGINFEKLMFERITGQEWHRNSIPFWVTGDINIGDNRFQVKFDSAELSNERTLRNLAATMAA